MILVTFIAFPVLAQFDVSGTTVTNYVWRGFDVLGGQPAFQPSATYSLGETGLSANLWGSWGITNRGTAAIRNFDEFDITVGYERSLAGVTMSAAYIYYTFPGMEDFPDEFSTNSEINFAAGFDNLPFTPAISVFYALNDKSWDGLYVNISGGKTIETETTDLNLYFSLGYSDQSLVTGLEGVDAGISDINLGVDTELTCCNLSLIPSFTFTYVPMEEVYPSHLIFWGGLTIGRSF